MARHDDWYRVGSTSSADCPHGSGPPGGCGNLGVALGVPVVDQHQVPEHGAPEPVGQPEIQRQYEISAFPGEVLRELTSHLIEATRSPQDARADLLREPCST